MEVQPLTLKDLFRIFPKAWCIAILFSSVLLLVGSEWVVLFSAVINISATYLLFTASTIIHESGHLLAAQAVGGVPKRMVLGIGHEVKRTEVAGVKIILNSIVTGGYALAIMDQESYIRLRHFVYILGGVFLNVLIAFLFYILFGFNGRYFLGQDGVDIASAIIFTNGIKIINLIPFYTSVYGMKLPSDGLGIIQLVFQPIKKEPYIGFMNSHFEAYESFERREYDKSYAIFSDMVDKIPGNPNALYNISTILIRRMEYDKAISILMGLVKRIETQEVKPYAGYIFNNLAWAHMMKGEIDTASPFATLAIKIAPKNQYIIGTYGAMLVEKGELETGMAWLNKNIDTEIPSPTSLLSAMYLMVCFHARHNQDSTNHYKNFVQSNLHKLEKDDLMLWERLLQKVNN